MISSFSLPVALTPENGFSLVATGSHMIEGAGKFYPQRTGHFHAFKLPICFTLNPRMEYTESFGIFQDLAPCFNDFLERNQAPALIAFLKTL